MNIGLPDLDMPKGGPEQGPVVEEKQPVSPENPEDQIELERSVAERATGSRQEKKPKASQPSKRLGVLTMRSGLPLAKPKPKPSPTQGCGDTPWNGGW